MNEPKNISANLIYYRLIALWVLCEAMLGGIIHAAKIPVSGLVVGSCAVICICLIAFYIPQKGAIIKATIIVAIFKMMLSPQAPPLAYLAVFFQGFLGELLFWNRNFYKLSCLLLGLIALLESALQRIIVLTIVYGNNFWKAINDFINELTRQKNFTNYSLIIAIGYIFIHVVVGLLIGWWAGKIPEKVFLWKQQQKAEKETTAKGDFLAFKKRKKKWLKKGIFIIWIFLVLLYCQSYFKIGRPILPSDLTLQIFIRSIIIVLAWYFVIGPLVSFLLKEWLEKRQLQSKEEIQQIAQLLPEMRRLIAASWQRAKEKRGIKKIVVLAKNIFANILIYDVGKKIYILTGPIQSGKTTKLLQWSANRKDVFGILTPVVDNKRIFLDPSIKKQFQMEARLNEENVFTIGRFVFSKNSFEKAINILKKAFKEKEGWLVVDEVGPLELRGEGFDQVLKDILEQDTDLNILLVARDSIVEKVLNYYDLKLDQVVIIAKDDRIFEK